MARRRADAKSGGPPRSEHRRRRETYPTKGDDDHGDSHGAAADHVEPRRGRGRDEAHRRADDWRRHHFVSPRTAGLSGDFPSVAGLEPEAERSRITAAAQ